MRKYSPVQTNTPQQPAKQRGFNLLARLRSKPAQETPWYQQEATSYHQSLKSRKQADMRIESADSDCFEVLLSKTPSPDPSPPAFNKSVAIGDFPIVQTVAMDSGTYDASPPLTNLTEQDNASCGSIKPAGTRTIIRSLTDEKVITSANSEKYRIIAQRVFFKLRIINALNKLLHDRVLYGTTVHVVDAGNKINWENLTAFHIQEEKEFKHILEKKTNSYMLDPASKSLKCWFTLIFLSSLVMLFWAPYAIAFKLENEHTTGYGWFFSTICIVDMIIAVNLGYYDNMEKLVLGRTIIVLRYVKTYAISDLICVIPMLNIVSWDPESRGMMFFLTLFCTLKLARSAGCIKIDLWTQFSNRRIINLSKFSVLITILAHFVSCGFIFLGLSNMENGADEAWLARHGVVDRDDIEIYLTSLYWTIQTVTTLGYGDIYPTSKSEIELSLAWIICGVAFYSYVISILTSSLVSRDVKKTIVEKRMKRFKNFCEGKKIPKLLKEAASLDIKQSGTKIQIDDKKILDIIKVLSTESAYELSMNLFGGAPKNILFFQDIKEVFVSNIVPLLELQIFSPFQLIYNTHDFASEMYFISKGNVHMTFSVFFINVLTMKPGSTFGEIELFDHQARMMTAGSGESPVETLVLKAASLELLDTVIPEAIYKLKLISIEKKRRSQDIIAEVNKYIEKVTNAKQEDHDLQGFDHMKQLILNLAQQGRKNPGVPDASIANAALGRNSDSGSSNSPSTLRGARKNTLLGLGSRVLDAMNSQLGSPDGSPITTPPSGSITPPISSFPERQPETQSKKEINVMLEEMKSTKAHLQKFYEDIESRLKHVKH